MQLNKDELSTVALSALINLLKLKGYDLDQIKREYDQEILGNLLSGSAPQFKSASSNLIQNLINEAHSNSLLQ